MSLNLDVATVRIIGAVIVLIGVGIWWYAVKNLSKRSH